jgi:hypothetical protein
MVPKERLVYASSEAGARELLERNPNFDVIPIDQGGNLCAYLERSSGHIRSIGLHDIVSDATTILDLVDILKDRRYCFVLVSNRIAGYVHFSDLNNRLVKLPYFIILEAFERYLVDKIGILITEDTLEKVLDSNRIKEIKDRMRRQIKNRAELGWVSLLSFDEIVRCGCYLGKLRLNGAEVQMISQTRNCVCHADRVLVGSHEDVKRLAKAKGICISVLADSGI